MNFSITETKRKIKNSKIPIALIVFITSLIMITTKQDIIQKSIEMSIKLCISSIIPAIFPFMILSDYIIGKIKINKDSKISVIFRKVFSINSSGILPFLVGNICGFPLGAQMASKLYDEGSITKHEYDRLVPLCSNPSFAFVISGVGCGMRGSFRDGVTLYIALLMATILTGIIWRTHSASDFHSVLEFDRFSLSGSIKNSAISCIYVSSYITFFSIFVGLIKSFFQNNIFSLILISFLEIGNAASIISKELTRSTISLPLTAFALGFSGISVYMQALCFSPSNAKNSHYIKMKLTEGIIAFALTWLITLLR
jgi:hypothetical protein